MEMIESKIAMTSKFKCKFIFVFRLFYFIDLTVWTPQKSKLRQKKRYLMGILNKIKKFRISHIFY